MNRMYTQFRYGLERRVVDLYVKVAIGATGAPTLSASASKGIASIARNSAGRYTVTLSDKYVDLLQASHTLILSSGDPAGAGGMVVRTNSVSSSTPTVVVEFLSETGAAEELSNGSTLLLKLELKASSV